MIARELRCSTQKVRHHIALTGGIRPTHRKRSVLRLSLHEREEVSRGIAAGLSARTISTLVGKTALTISHEIERNGGRARYRATWLMSGPGNSRDGLAPSTLDRNEELSELVRFKLAEDCSPQQIAAWLKTVFPDEPDWWISHDAIYRTLCNSIRLSLPSTLVKHLRSGRRVRHPCVASKMGQGRGRLVGIKSIRSRLVQVQQRTEVGAWEGDLVIGKDLPLSRVWSSVPPDDSAWSNSTGLKQVMCGPPWSVTSGRCRQDRYGRSLGVRGER